uniref:Uncharacterized protein LOC105038825 n=1 Tax=Elaeis guineensis var. tenera TaxID=51953 RepID=A0A8N4EQW6_ELAGV|nr:uncharacterized protein LOC105038825 [Elaeis guineensis]
MCHPSEASDLPFSYGRRNRRPGSDPLSSLHRPFPIPILILIIMTIGSSSSKTSATISHHPPSSSTTSSTQACAACKYQRRKCPPDCTLAPYFPASQPRQFLNAHRLFGVSKILKMIHHIDPRHRPDAMRSIIFQSNARAQDPVGGCYRIIRDFECQLQRDNAELALIHRQLAFCRARARNQANLSPADLNDLPVLLPNPPDDDDGGSDHDDYGYADNMSLSITDSLKNSKNGLNLPASQQQQKNCAVEEQNAKPVVDMFDVRQDIASGDSSRNNADACTRTKMSKRRPRHDLSGAASLLTLTNSTGGWITMP